MVYNLDPDPRDCYWIAGFVKPKAEKGTSLDGTVLRPWVSALTLRQMESARENI